MNKRDKLKKKFFGQHAARMKDLSFATYLLTGNKDVELQAVGDCLLVRVGWHRPENKKEWKLVRHIIKRLYKDGCPFDKIRKLPKQ